VLGSADSRNVNTPSVRAKDARAHHMSVSRATDRVLVSPVKRVFLVEQYKRRGFGAKPNREFSHRCARSVMETLRRD
jgi:hypothetical protein